MESWDKLPFDPFGLSLNKILIALYVDGIKLIGVRDKAYGWPKELGIISSIDIKLYVPSPVTYLFLT